MIVSVDHPVLSISTFAIATIATILSFLSEPQQASLQASPQSESSSWSLQPRMRGHGRVCRDE